jgi:hypothetical protein
MSYEDRNLAALAYINECIADFTDAVKAETPVNEISQLMLATVETHLGAVRFLLLGEDERALGLLANFEMRNRMHVTGGGK